MKAKILGCAMFFFMIVAVWAKPVELVIYYNRIYQPASEQAFKAFQDDPDYRRDAEKDGFSVVKSPKGGYYWAKRQEVTSTDEMMVLTGCKKGPVFNPFVDNARKQLVDVYRNATENPSFRSMVENAADFNPEIQKWAKNTRNGLPVINIELYDTQDVDPDQAPFEQLLKDFWPCASGDTIHMGSAFGEKYSSQWKGYLGLTSDFLVPTLIHEFAHILDARFDVGDYTQSLGFDRIHLFNELTSDKVAFCEGWANYWELLLSGKAEETLGDGLLHCGNGVGIQVEGQGGGYSFVGIDEIPTEREYYISSEGRSRRLEASDLLKVEGFNTLVMYQITKRLKNEYGSVVGEKLMWETMHAFNRSGNTRDLWNFLHLMVEKFGTQYPKLGEMIVETIKFAGGNKFSQKELNFLFGGWAIQNNRTSQENSPTTTGVPIESNTAAPGSSENSSVQGGRSSASDESTGQDSSTSEGTEE